MAVLAAAVLAAPAAVGVAVVPAQAHADPVWVGEYTMTQHVSGGEGDNDTFTTTMSLRFQSMEDLADPSKTTMTYDYSETSTQFHAGEFDCTITITRVGRGSVPASVRFTILSESQYRVQSDAEEMIAYDVVATITGGPGCSGVTSGTSGSFRGFQDLTHTPAQPQGLDPATLVGAVSVPSQQGVIGPVGVTWDVRQVGHFDDDDGDGVPNADDECAGTPAGTPVNSAGCADEDGDGVADSSDTCKGTPAGTPVNSAGCPVVDDDGDGVPNADDECAGTPVGTPVNSAGCADEDGDGVADENDACEGTPAGTPVTSIGCPDSDGDGVADELDQCAATPAGTPVDAIGCPNSDSDGDGVTDGLDQCAGTPAGTVVDPVGCPVQANSDDDKWPDSTDNCDFTDNEEQVDSDEDGVGDACDLPKAPLPASCKKRVHVTFQATGQIRWSNDEVDPRPRGNGCWDMDRPSPSPDGGGFRGDPNGEFREHWTYCRGPSEAAPNGRITEPEFPMAPGWWMFDDVRSQPNLSDTQKIAPFLDACAKSAAQSDDPDAIKRTRSYLATYARPPANKAPQLLTVDELRFYRDRYGIDVFFFQLFDDRLRVSNQKFVTAWKARRADFAGMVNASSPIDSDRAVYRAVLKLCNDTADTRRLGIFGGAQESSRPQLPLTGTRLRAVTNALDACTS